MLKILNIRLISKYTAKTTYIIIIINKKTIKQTKKKHIAKNEKL